MTFVLATKPPSGAIWFAGGLAVAILAPQLASTVAKVQKVVQRLLESPWRQRIAREKRRLLEEELTKAELYAASLGVDDAQRIEACETVAQLRAIQSGPRRVTAQAILKWHLKRAIIAHRATNCLTEMHLEEAVVSAAALDTAYETSGVLLPLHGVVTTIKDSVGVDGMDSTLGLFRNCFVPQRDCPTVTALRRAGVVIIAKTNVPQTLLSFECVNPVFGTCTNPFNPNHTCGGSSGGEGAMLALRGSLLGIGTDIGGSLRIPAHFCGVFAIKPTQYRLSIRNCRASIPGQEAVSAVIGPMSRNIDDLVDSFRVLANSECWKADGSVHAVPFREDQFELGRTKKLRLGYFIDDGLVPATPACARAVHEAVEALRRAGHEVVPIAFSGEKLLLTNYGLISADGAETIMRGVAADPLIPPLARLYGTTVMPSWQKKIIGWLLRRKDCFLAELFLRLRKITIAELYQLVVSRNECRNEFVENLTVEALDAVICPGLATPALRNGDGVNVPFGFAYTGYFNVLDAAVVMVPVTRVDRSQDAWPTDNPPLRQPVTSPLMRRLIRKAYDASEMHGLPVGVQIVGHRMREEFVLGAAQQLVSALKAH